MESVAKYYYPELDIVKGIAILLVILGHSFCTYPIDINSEFPLLGKIVRSFQMPLFFMASGFLFNVHGSFKDFVKKKLWRLIVPWIGFSIITVMLRIVFSSFTRSGEISVATSLFDIVQGHYYWFLYALTFIMIVCRLVTKQLALIGLSIFSVVCCILFDIRNVTFFEMGRIIYFFPYFCIGMFIQYHYKMISDWSMYKITMLVFILVLIYATAMSIQKECMVYIVALSGSLLTWGGSILLSHKNMAFLKHFGKYSLQYYLNHLLIMLPCYYFAKFTPYLQLLTIYVTGIGMSFIMLKIEMRFAFTRRLCGLK